jgi:BirA family biotin operon repressor/biotin-[acetyl-CoA-carboxylase] ligase
VDLPRTREIAPRLRILDRIGSTNDALAELSASGGEPHLSTVVTLDQTGGRGRLGRTWVAPAGKALAASVLLRPVSDGGGALAADSLGWLPLIAGAAMSTSIDALLGGGRTGLKWPNDVQVDGLKVCGVLAELTPSGAVIMGTGVNLALGAAELPVPTATSLTLAGLDQPVDELADRVLSGYLRRLEELLRRFVATGGDAVASGIHRTVSEWCRTLGKPVRVSLPDGTELYGTATGIDPDGCILVRTQRDDTVRSVAAGDITHLRYE